MNVAPTRFIRTPRYGETVVYYRGFLMKDQAGDFYTRGRAKAFADAAMKLSDEGAVALTQRKIGFHDYEYRMTGLLRNPPPWEGPQLPLGVMR